MKRILITGSRNWEDPWVIARAIESAIGDTPQWDVTIVHGDCPTGADAIAKQMAVDSGVAEEAHPADWNTHGKRAGYVRNKEMVDLGADVCLAFPIGESRGTRMTIKLAEDAGIPTQILEGSESNVPKGSRRAG